MMLAPAPISSPTRFSLPFLVATNSNDTPWVEEAVLGMAPWHGRLWVGSDRMAEQSLPPGMVLPAMVHGGPGRAGGGEELGGVRGIEFYMQRTAVQGFKGQVHGCFGAVEEAKAT